MTINDRIRLDAAQIPEIEGFEVLGVVGVGGMSVVYKARQLAFDRIVALKVLQTRLVTDSVAIQRFMQAARMTTSLRHPNLGAVFASGASDIHLFLVMEFLEGKSLKETVEERGPLPLEQARQMFIAVCEGLRVAHGKGIVHRDLKPANIMLVPGDDEVIPKIVDFGIAKMYELKGGEAQRLTQSGSIIGSPAYMSPEQFSGGTIDARSDLYALGCTMFYALSGRVPFESDNIMELMRTRMTVAPPAPSSVSPSVPVAFDNIVMRCMQPRQESRYQSCEELLSALRELDMNAPNMVPAFPKLSKAGGRGWNKSLFQGLLAAVLVGSGLAIAGIFVNNYLAEQRLIAPAEAKLRQASSLMNEGQYNETFEILRSVEYQSLPEFERGKVALAEFRLLEHLDEIGDSVEGIFNEMTEMMEQQRIYSSNAAHAQDLSRYRHYLASHFKYDVLSTLMLTNEKSKCLRDMLAEVEQDKEAVQPDRYRTGFLVLMGRDFQSRGKLENAERCYRQAEEAAIASGSKELQVEALWYHARFLADQKLNGEARAVIKNACALAPSVATEHTVEGVKALAGIAELAHLLFSDRRTFDYCFKQIDEISKDVVIPQALAYRVSTLRALSWNEVED